MDGRTFIVSNRLPLATSVDSSGKLILSRSSGGLVTGLEEVHESGRSLWVGCLSGLGGAAFGKGIDPEQQEELDRQGLCLVVVPEILYRSYYEGFSNSAVWPLFHYMPDRCQFTRSNFDAYAKVNEIFAERVASLLEPDDCVWIHDYQLMLLPAMLRKLRPEATIGFFLHTPFPSAEVFRVMPWRRELLRGLLGADLIGFHTLEYMRHFSNATARVLGLEPRLETLEYGKRTVSLGAFPLGVNVKSLYEDARDGSCKRYLEGLHTSYEGRKLILGVDRLDYTKGVPARLEAYATFLEKNPKWIGRVTLVQVSVPSRVKVEEYREIKREVDGLVGEINGRFGQPGYVPIHYLFRHLERGHLLALYRRADVALVTPYRDGLNLVCKEYVAVKGSEPGVLVMSEFAGAAAEMGEAILVNPWSSESMVDGISRALDMDDEQAVSMMGHLWERLSMQDNRAWSRNYMDALMAVRVVNRTAGFKAAGPPDAEELVRRFLEAPRAFIFLDYDGTIVPLADRPDQAVPSDRVLDLLRDMASIPSFRLCIVSGRDRAFLEKHVPLDVTFAAEHGACVRHAGEPDCVHLVDDSAFRDRRENVLGIMRDFQRRIPGSTIEEKEFGLVWHYRMADPIFAQQQALVLADALGGLLQRTSLGVMIAKKAVEVTHMGINKGDAVRVVLDHEKFDPKADVLLTVGDDRTDDDMFRVYANSNISIGVSDTPLLSSYTMEQSELVDLLTDLTRRARGRQYRLWAGQR